MMKYTEGLCYIQPTGEYGGTNFYYLKSSDFQDYVRINRFLEVILCLSIDDTYTRFFNRGMYDYR